MSTVGALVLVGTVPARAHQAPTAAPVHRAAGAALVFDDVTVVDVAQGRLLPRRRVVIVGNRIQAVGDAGGARLPRGAQVVDARGKYLIPGLWDMHIHPLRLTDIFYPLLLANGVTGIRDAGSPVPLDTLRRWREEIQAGRRVGPPRQVLSGHSLETGEQCPPPSTEFPTMCVSGDIARASHVIDSLIAAGVEMLKFHGVERPVYFAWAAEARRRGMPFGGHVGKVTTDEAADSGARLIDHLRFVTRYTMLPFRPWDEGLVALTARCLDPKTASLEPCRQSAEKFRRHDTWAVMDAVVPNRMYPANREFWAGGPLPAHWLHDSVLMPTDSASPMRFMERVNFPILPGTDMDDFWVLGTQEIPGFFLQAQLAAYVAAGLSPLNALRSATLSPAKALHAIDSLGTVAQGKLADLVLLDADPLADITNVAAIRAVVANGHYYDRAALDRVLADGRTAYAAALAEATAKRSPAQAP